MPTNFQPDYRYMLATARNEKPARVPIYEHLINDGFIETILGRPIGRADGASPAELEEYFRNYIEFYAKMGYDTVTFEGCAGPAMPGSGALGGHKDGVIKNRADFERYPWNDVPELYFQKFAPQFDLVRKHMPAGMKAIGGVGNGPFECAEDVVGFFDLCYIKADDPELYGEIFAAIGLMLLRIWERFLAFYADLFCVLRIGDDMGFKTMTLLPADDIRRHIVPLYAKIVRLAHSYGKPFLWHSCGNIFEIMDDMIDVAGIDAKHSNEDIIAPYSEWIGRYGDRIANFGGVDTDHLSQQSEAFVRAKTAEVVRLIAAKKGGGAIGSGNSIPEYVRPENYLAMVETVREARGDFRGK